MYDKVAEKILARQFSFKNTFSCLVFSNYMHKTLSSPNELRSAQHPTKEFSAIRSGSTFSVPDTDLSWFSSILSRHNQS